MKKIASVILLILAGCSGNPNDTQIYNGRLEVETISLSAKTPGVIDSLFVREGHRIARGQILAKVNDDRYRAQKRQQTAQLEEIRLNLQNLNIQVRQLKPQLDLAKETLKKTENLFKQGAATELNRDELAAKVDVLQAQMDGLTTNRKIIASREEQLSAGIEITDLNLADSRILSPINGLVINAYHEPAEVVGAGVILFDVADLSRLEATIYVPLKDLNRIRLGQTARVTVDGVDTAFDGRVSWIASEVEFTPKTILTRETRTTLVYAVDVDVPNPDGLLKIGMPVDVEI